MPAHMIAMHIEPIEDGGKHFVDISVGNLKLPRKGPFISADKAKAAADLIIKELTPNLPATTNEDVVILNGKPVELTSDLGRKLVTAATRAAEGIAKDSDIIDEFELSISEFEALKNNIKLGRLIRQCGRQRIANGARAREHAQGIHIKSPLVLDSILSDSKASPRHRIEACKEVRQVALGDNAEDPATSAELFHIVFNLGGDHIEKIEKVIEPRPKQIESELNVDK